MTNTSMSAEKYAQIERLKEEAQIEMASKMQNFFDSILEYSYKYSGAGSYYSQFQKTLSKIDRYGIRTVTPNNEHAGLTFITRPKLNLTSANLKQNRVLSMLDSEDPLSVQFMIRMLLDSKLCNDTKFSPLVYRSPLLDENSPFLTPLMNCIESASGFPSYNIETYTTEGGFFSEDLTFAAGSDRNRKSFDLQFSFLDIQGGICAAILQMWMEYISAVSVGEMIAYAEDINAQRINYTVSAYRFLLDPSKRYITRWCKCTGGFPISRPSGAVFDINNTEVFVEAAKKFSVTFKFNHMGVENDPVVLKEFNMIMQRACPGLVTNEFHSIREDVPNTAFGNYTGLPYIYETEYGPELVFKALPEENVDNLSATLTETSQQIETTKSLLEQRISDIIKSPETNSYKPNTDIVYYT